MPHNERGLMHWITTKKALPQEFPVWAWSDAPYVAHSVADLGPAQYWAEIVPPKRGTTGLCLLQTWLDDCAAKGIKPIPESDPVFEYQKAAKIPRQWLSVVWMEFKHRSIQSGKKYRDWKRAFRNCVEQNWYGIWFYNGTEFVMTFKGKEIAQRHKVMLK